MKDRGRPVCGKAGCRNSSMYYQGHQHLCSKHYRFGQMRANAKRHGKLVPTLVDLENMLPIDMCCGICQRAMNWLSKDGHDTVITLQHYRDGTMGFLCLSCNTRHAFTPGDSFKDPNKKRCPRCVRVLPLDYFCRDNSRSGPMKLKSWCRTCSLEAYNEWKNKVPA